MSDILFSSLIIITVILVIVSIVLSIMAYRAAKDKCKDTNESATYSTYSAGVAGISVLLIGVAFLLYLFACPAKCPVAPKDDTKELVAKATAALQKHANELKVHAEVLNDAFGKVNNISNDLSATCKDAGTIC